MLSHQDLLREVEDHYGSYARVNVLVVSHYRLVEELALHLSENYNFSDAENHFAEILKFKIPLLNGKILQL